MNTPIYPEHILAPHIDRNAFTTTWNVNTPPEEIIGTGPFILDTYIPGERLTLIRNSDYYLTDQAGNKLPYLADITYIIGPSFETTLNAFLAGITDTYIIRDATDLARLETQQNNKNFTIHKRGPSFSTEFLAFNANPNTKPRHRPTLYGSDETQMVLQ